MTTIGFLHTSHIHVPTFQALVDELGRDVGVATVVDEALLEQARAAGLASSALADQVDDALDQLHRDGAEIVICTCSTIGGLAEAIGARRGQRVVRVDRAMAERAIEVGGHVIVVAVLESTLAPTRELLESVASERGAEITIEMAVIDGAWERFEAGDRDGYVTMIAEALPALADRCDTIVLAQASMAAAADRTVVGVPVLSSPRLAVEALLG